MDSFGRRFSARAGYPVDVNPVAQRMRALRFASARIEVSDPDLRETMERAERDGCREFDGLLRRLLIGDFAWCP